MKAIEFIKRLESVCSAEEAKKMQRFFKTGAGQYGEGDVFIGVKMATLFTLVKEFIDMPPAELEKLLESPLHEARAGACSIMAKQASSKKTPETRRKELYALYLRRHDRINNWDLVDLASYKVVGSYLFDFGKPRKILYKLARSKNLWERRTSIVSTLYFIRKGDTGDAFRIAEMLAHDKEDLIGKGTGWALRYAGQKEPRKLLQFLNKHAATMSRVALRYAIEHLDKKRRQHYLEMKKRQAGS